MQMNQIAHLHFAIVLFFCAYVLMHSNPGSDLFEAFLRTSLRTVKNFRKLQSLNKHLHSHSNSYNTSFICFLFITLYIQNFIFMFNYFNLHSFISLFIHILYFRMFVLFPPYPRRVGWFFNVKKHIVFLV